MTDKTRTVVVIETHQQIIVRRSRHVVSRQVEALPLRQEPVESCAPAVGLTTPTVKRGGARLTLDPLRNLYVLCMSAVNHFRPKR